MTLELIIGPMFAGKSSTILQRVKRAEVIGIKTFIVTSVIDTRYNTNTNLVKTHDKQMVDAVGLKDIKEITRFAAFHDAKLIIIEEAQFFSGLYDMVKNLVEVYKRDVIVVGLDGDSERKPFGEILELIPLADTITKLTALCKRCGDGTPALFTYSKWTKDTQVCVGDADIYEALCRKHYLQPA
jgi:thymidine kinase